MLDDTATPDRATAEIEREYSPERLLLVYARGRVAHFLGRQVLTLTGTLMLFAVSGTGPGLVALLCALTGEAVDCLYLRSVPARLNRGEPLKRLMRISTATAAFQALTIAVCVTLAWDIVDGHAPLFGIAFLAGAAVNGGLVLAHHRSAGIARLAVYGLTLCFLFLDHFLDGNHHDITVLLNATGAVILVYMVVSFLDFMLKVSRRNRANLSAMADHRRQVEQANAELVKSQKEAQRLALVARNANDSVFLTDPDGRIAWVNDTFTRITGYDAKDAIGAAPGDLLNGPDTSPETIAAMADAARHGRPFRGEIQNRRRDGSVIWMESNQVPVHDPGGRVEMTVAIERDVTAAREAARELAEARDRAEEGARAKAEFLANMSHEIRTPMNGVIGMADLLCETPLDSDQRAYADAIRSSALSLLALINDILDLSKLDADKMAIHPVDFDLHHCLGAAILMFRHQATEKAIDLSLDIDSAVPRHVSADDVRLRQILVNLIGNAIKFTSRGSVGVAVSLRGEGMVAIDVRDTGIGIPAAHLERVFERFSQADSDTTRQFGGTGLGLTISNMLAGAMGGTIGVVSTPGEGSCFTLALPVSAPETAPDTAPVAPSGPADMQVLNGQRVLVAEDNRVNRMLVQKYLRDTQVELFFAHDGAQAVDMARNLAPDLVLMDMSMPRMSGLEAAAAIRGSDMPQPAIVALTANAFDSDRDACLRAGMDGFLTKPVRRGDLLDALVRHCSARMQHSAL